MFSHQINYMRFVTSALLVAAASAVPMSLLERNTDDARKRLNAALDKLRGDKTMFETEAADYKKRAAAERKEANKIHI